MAKLPHKHKNTTSLVGLGLLLALATVSVQYHVCTSRREAKQRKQQRFYY